MSLLWVTATDRTRAWAGGEPPLDSCSCGCGCEPDGDWHWSQQPWCRCVANNCDCVTDQQIKKDSARWHDHPTEESTQHIINHYGFEDAYPSGAVGPEAWKGVKEGYVGGSPGEALHPVNQKMRDDIARNGIQEPIRIDYHRDPPVVTDGHTRLWHAEALGLPTVPVKHGDWWAVHGGDGPSFYADDCGED